MIMSKAIATAPGKPTRHVKLTPSEETARIAESDTAALDGKRRSLLADFETEGMRRIAAAIPEIDSVEAVKALRALWPALDPARRTAEMKLVRNLFTYARKTAPGKIAAMITLAEFDAVAPADDDPFGDGDGWPV